MAPFAAVTRRERFLGALRYYGFAIVLAVIGLGIVGLATMEYMKTQRAAEFPVNDPSVSQLQALASRAAESAATPEALGAALNVFTTPSGAMVSVDGVPVGPTPVIGHAVRPGYYLLTLSGSGFTPLDTLVDVTAGGSVFVSLDMNVNGALARADEAGPTIRVDQPPTRAVTPPRRTETPATRATRTPPAEPRVSRPARARTGALAVVTDPPDARVLLDGTSAGEAPLVLSDVPVGEHEIVVHAPGYAAASRTVTVSEGRQETLRLTLRAQKGTLAVLVKPWGSIYVEGTLMKRDTDVLYTAELPTGFHTVRVVHPTLGERVQTVEIRPDATTRVDFQFDTN